MYTLDRFARNRYDSAIYKAKLKKNGVKVFYAKQPMPDTPEGIILESVLEGYLLSAVEQGLVTPATKDRLEELEQERRDLEGQIAREEMKKPLLTKERIVYWLTSFKSGDIRDIEYQRRVIDTLVNSVFVYDDGDKGRKIVLTFNISGSNTLTITSSDIECLTPPKQYNPNLVPIGHGFGFIVLMEEIEDW